MEPFYFHPTLLLRTPYFAYTKHKSLSLQQSLNLQPVKNAQLLAAPAFYDLLKKNDFREDVLTAKQKHTVENYLNRMHYRCTPFGSFAGTLPIYWSDDTAGNIVLKPSSTTQILPAFGCELNMVASVKNDLLTVDGFTYFANPANVLVGNEMRYLTASDPTEKASIREFTLKSISVNKSFKQLWAFCSKPNTMAAIIEYLSQHYEMDNVESTAFFQTLIEEQLLLSNAEANISDTPYSERLLQMVKQDDHLLSAQIRARHINSAEPLPEMYEQIPDSNIKSNAYAHVNMCAVEGNDVLNFKHQQKISEGLYAIQKLHHDAELSDLESFKNGFLQKFDQRCIPLLEALDPELGINYAGLSNVQDDDALLDKLSDGKTAASSQKNIQWSPVHAMLLQQWQLAERKNDPVLLNDILLEKLPSSDLSLPTSTSAIFKVHNDTVVLEHIGGVTANALLGRFSIFHTTIAQCCEDVSDTENAINPDVIFAEIVSIQDTHAANIEKRKQFYQYEIPILTTSTLPYEQQIQLNDLLLMVRNNRIILFSAKHGMEVIPKLSTAFNYKRSTLSVYRFLCDLQYQGMQRIRPFKMEHFFPDLPFYPRVMYRNTILQLAIWHVKKETILPIVTEQNNAQKVKQLATLFNNLNIPPVFALKEHDHKLVFKMNDPNDLLSFLENVRNANTITIEEFPFTEEETVVTDACGNPHQHEFVATLINRSKVYKSYQPLIRKALSAQRYPNISFMPGSNWMYFKIYCHHSFSDTLLLKKIKPLIKQLRGLGDVEKWFFVRYVDTGFHIRLRLFIPPEMQGHALSLLHQLLEKELQSGIISNMQLDTYKPEWERYGHQLLTATEACFHHGSEWTLQLLEMQQRGKVNRTEIAMLHIDSIFNAVSITYHKRQEMLLNMYQSLYTEHHLEKQDQIELGNKFRNYRERISLWLNSSNKKPKAQLDFERSLKHCFSKMEENGAQSSYTWIADLIHMQLNRVFSDQPRKKEMVVYYLLSKWYMGEDKKLLHTRRAMWEPVLA